MTAIRAWFSRHPRITMILAPLLVVTGLGAGGIVLAAPASATVCSSASWGRLCGWEDDLDGNSVIKAEFGDILTDGYCVEVKSKTSSGVWTTAGFHGSTSDCSTGAGNSNFTWKTAVYVYGLRLYRGNGSFFTVCSTHASCLAM